MAVEVRAVAASLARMAGMRSGYAGPNEGEVCALALETCGATDPGQGK